VAAVLLGPIDPKNTPYKVIFEGIQITKLIIPVNQAQKVDEKNIPIFHV